MAASFEEKCDTQQRALQFEPFTAKHGGCMPINYGKSKEANPHMRGFWFSTFGFMFAFIGWFALAPLTPVVRIDLGVCDNAGEIQALLAANPDLDDSAVECACGPGTECA